MEEEENKTLSLVLFSGTDDNAELLALAKDMGVKLIPCQMTMEMLGLKREDLIDGLEEPAGATTALLSAQGSSTLSF